MLERLRPLLSDPAAYGLEELAQELNAQMIAVVNELLGGAPVARITAEELRRLQERFETAAPADRLAYAQRFFAALLPSIRKLAERQPALDAPAADEVSPVVVAGPAINLNLNLAWKPEAPGSETLVIDIAATSLKANGSPTNVMEGLKLLGAGFRSVGVRGPDGAGIGQVFFELLAKSGIDPADWPATALDVDFAPTATVAERGLDFRFLPPSPVWNAGEISGYADTVRRVAAEAVGQQPSGALAVTSRVPENAPPTYLSEMFQAGKGNGMFVVYDPKTATLGNAPVLAEIRKSGPHLITPNIEEFSLLAGLPPGQLVDQNPEQIVRIAREIIGRSDIPAILISLGENGALLVDAERAAYANVAAVPVVGPGGTGDAGLASLLDRYARLPASKQPFTGLSDSDFVTLLRAYVAGGAAGVQMPGDESPSREAVKAMLAQVHTRFIRSAAPEQLPAALAGLYSTAGYATAPYRDQMWVPRLGRFLYTDPDSVLSPDNSGSDLYLDFIFSDPARFRGKQVLDPVTGSGVVAFGLALAGAEKVVGTDIAESAVRLAQANLELVPEAAGRVTFGVSDVYANLAGVTDITQFDAVVANNPTNRKDPSPGSDAAFITSAGENFEVPNKLVQGLDAVVKPGGDGIYMTTRIVPEEDPPRRLTAAYLGKLIPPGWTVADTGFQAMGRSEAVPVTIQRVHRAADGLEEVRFVVDVNRFTADSVPVPSGRIFVQPGAVVPSEFAGMTQVILPAEPAAAAAFLAEQEAQPGELAFVAPELIARAPADWELLFRDRRMPAVEMGEEALQTLRQLVAADPAYLAAFVAGIQQGGGGLIKVLGLGIEQGADFRRLTIYA